MPISGASRWTSPKDKTVTASDDDSLAIIVQELAAPAYILIRSFFGSYIGRNDALAGNRLQATSIS